MDSFVAGVLSVLLRRSAVSIAFSDFSATRQAAFSESPPLDKLGFGAATFKSRGLLKLDDLIDGILFKFILLLYSV